MLKKIALLATLASVLAVAVALPAVANSIPTTGSRISLFVGPFQYPANTPFHVNHGFACYLNANVSDCANAGTSFVLYVDGVQQPSQKDVQRLPFGDTYIVLVSYLTNFPDGLSAGTHTFTGVWYLNGSFSYERTVTVTFA